ncbi:MAG: HpcH/HpaI aldolase/citrate lyase family protein [Pseudomonadota bacterium]
MAVIPGNPFKETLQNGERLIGFWLSTGSPAVTEIAAHSGFDWVLIDMEHAPNDVAHVLEHLRAVVGGSASPIVRPPWNDQIIIKRLLDIGVKTFLIPYVQSAEEARAAVAATRYPPDGVRGIASNSRANDWGRSIGYFGRANDEICVLVQVETQAALGEIEAIAAVDGVDGIFIGPSDLAGDMGFVGQPSHPDVHKAIVDAGQRIQAAGKPAGFLSARDEDIRLVLDNGFSFVAVGSDTALLARHSSALAMNYRE